MVLDVRNGSEALETPTSRSQELVSFGSSTLVVGLAGVEGMRVDSSGRKTNHQAGSKTDKRFGIRRIKFSI